jgi:uridine kinase
MFLFEFSGRGFDSRHLHLSRGGAEELFCSPILFAEQPVRVAPLQTAHAGQEHESVRNGSITHIVKRTGAVVPFNPERITNAIYRAAVAVGGRDRETAEGLTRQVVSILEDSHAAGTHPTVEEIQDIVEKVLIENGHARVAKAYILYREERARRRREKAGRGYRESGNIPWRKIYEVLRWSVDHDLYTVEHLNERMPGRVCPASWRVGSRLRGGHRYRRPAHRGPPQEVRIGHHRRALLLGQDDDHHQAGRAPGPGGAQPDHFHVDNYFFDLELHPGTSLATMTLRRPRRWTWR